MPSFDICIVNGAYRSGGAGDQMAQYAAAYFTSKGLTTKTLVLRDIPLEFCTNCRACMLSAQPLGCVIEDDFQLIVKELEEAKAYVLISPTNMGDVTALVKRLLERMAVFGYWPWGAKAPKYRNTPLHKKAVVLSSCAAPALVGRVFFRTLGTLKKSARLLGARTVGNCMLGMCANAPIFTLSFAQKKSLEGAFKKLLPC